MVYVPATEEYFAQLTRAIGDGYLAISQGIGTEDIPGSASFELAQLNDVLQHYMPKFGVLSTLVGGNAPFQITYPDPSGNPYLVQVGAGYVGYTPTGGTSQQIIFYSQSIPIRYYFAATYPTNYQYGVALGIPVDEAKKSVQTYTSSVSHSALATDVQLQIANVSLAESLGFPLKANVGNNFVIFSGVNASGTALLVDPSFNGGGGCGQLGFAAAPLTRVNFIYEPRVHAIYGLPCPSTTVDPLAFGYMPQLPSDWLPVAQIIVVNPQTPYIATNGSSYAIASTVQAWPDPSAATPLFGEADAKTLNPIITSARNSLKAIRNAAVSSALMSGVEQYTQTLAQNPQTSFRSYWASMPYEPTTQFSRGISFENYERFEFSDSFAQAYFAARGQDVQHTFGIFRGDIFGGKSILLPNSGVTGVSAVSKSSNPLSSTIPRGTYVYGVSAVFNSPGLASGETAPNYATAIAAGSSPTFYMNAVGWNAITLNGQQPAFYHIYRRASLSGQQAEYRLTTPGQITASGNLTSPDPTLFTAYAVMSTQWEAVQFVPSSGYIGAIGVNLSVSALLTNPSEQLTISIHTDDSGPNDLVATGTPISYSALTVAPAIMKSIITPVTSGWNFTPGATYWLVLQQSNAPSGGNIQLLVDTDGGLSNVDATSTNGSYWTLNNAKEFYSELYAFVDTGTPGQSLIQRGVKLTGKVAQAPRNLRVYVPNVTPDAGAFSRVPTFAPDSGNISATENTLTKNDMVVTVTAQLGATGAPTSFTVTVPKGTARNTAFPLGGPNDLFDRIIDMQIVPGSNLTINENGFIQWDLYDFITVETVP